MRLSPNEIEVFTRVLSYALKEGDGSLYLYGSRTDDSLKGGDIDLLLVINSCEKAREFQKERASLLSQFKKHLGERRIDFSILSMTQLSEDVFYANVFRTAVLLNKW